MSDFEPETEVVISTPKLVEAHKVQRSIEVPNDSSLATMVSSLESTEFDENKIRYESPLSKIPTPNDLRVLGNFTNYEISVVGIKEDGVNKMRMITGEALATDTRSLNSGIDYLANQLRQEDITPDDPRFRKMIADSINYYPIIDDQGELTRRQWGFRIHNHPSGVMEPSLDDIRTSIGAEKEVIATKAGVTVIRVTGKLSDELLGYLPESQRNISTKDILYNKQLMELISILAESRATTEYQAKLRENYRYTGSLDMAKQLKIAEMVGIEVTLLRWDEDKEKIQQLCNSLLE